MRNTEKSKRNHELLAYRMAGHNNKDCAEEFQLTAARVGQIVRRQSVIEAREMAKKMAEAGTGYEEIASTLYQTYRPVSNLIDEHYSKVFAQNALMAVGRYDEVDLQTGLWTRCWPPQMEKSIQMLLEKTVVYVKGDILSFNADGFLQEESGIFALALSQRFGYPIQRRDKDEHFFCLSEVENRRAFIDVRGITTNWSHFTYSEQKTSEGMFTPVDVDMARADATKRLGEKTVEQLLVSADGLINALPPYTYDVGMFVKQIHSRVTNAKIHKED